LQITPGVASEEEAAAAAREMLAGFQAQDALQPFIRDFEVGLSIGVALFPSMSSDCNELMKLADIAMYHAKYNGKNNFAVYRPGMEGIMENNRLSIR
ncbi:MAG: diguanylate cyclase, partial [Candidatus Accumulibacter sp.]|nr:diguanylate cyclase [Accumulibacter sp.]